MPPGQDVAIFIDRAVSPDSQYRAATRRVEGAANERSDGEPRRPAQATPSSSASLSDLWPYKRRRAVAVAFIPISTVKRVSSFYLSSCAAGSHLPGHAFVLQAGNFLLQIIS